ncbi:MAG: DUF4926 domain-containing protein [Leptothrix ochracea]|uniref:DUF4926 domain-containing protein n=1 Tax=Leptothrix ochracea TaxID=735331 RepID=UPI0034E1C252
MPSWRQRFDGVVLPKGQSTFAAFHPFCLCRQRPSLRATMAKQATAGEAAYLRSLINLSKAGQVMGSQAKAEAVLNGAPFDEVVNTGRDPLYKLMDGVGSGAGWLSQNHQPCRIHKHCQILRIGITQDNASVLYSAIHAGLKSAPSVKKHADKHGQRYEVDIPVTGPAGSAYGANRLDCSKRRRCATTHQCLCDGCQMMFELLDVVRASADIPEFSVKAGDVGTIVEVYDDGEYEVEFCNDKGETMASIAMPESQMKPAHTLSMMAV